MGIAVNGGTAYIHTDTPLMDRFEQLLGTRQRIVDVKLMICHIIYCVYFVANLLESIESHKYGAEGCEVSNDEEVACDFSFVAQEDHSLRSG